MKMDPAHVAPVRVVLAEDHNLVRAGLRSLLGELGWVDVVGEAADGRTVLRLIAELKPDIVLMDITMNDLNGLEATERLVRQRHRTRVIILSMHSSEEYVRRALAVGAAGYLLKDADRAELELALRSVSRGGSYLSPAVSQPVITDYAARAGREGGGGGRLTPRQREILQLIAEGHSTREIARKLTLSAKTIETHRSKLMTRLDIHDIAGLVRYAIRSGMTTSEL
jgi:DNA-binding NarL/FixJ family response regulator